MQQPARPPAQLSAAQLAALEYVRRGARHRHAQALRRLGPFLDEPVDPARLTAIVRAHGRVTLNFHPDRMLADGRTVAAAIVRDGRYRSQFETGISNGGLTAFPGGDRDRWEHRMFGGAYQAPGTSPAERPTYGGLNLLDHPDGASPRFGSCHLRLRPEVLERCTFRFGDSFLDGRDLGTIDAFESVLAGLAEAARGTGQALGATGVDPVAHLLALPGRPVRTDACTPPGRSLDDYIEVQVHGAVEPARDAEALVLDPSFRGTPTERSARRIGVAVEWHAGFELAPDVVPEDFRGPVMPPLADRICRGFSARTGRFDAEVLGRAAASVVTEPDRWAQWGTQAETLQYVKQLWHVLVRFGEAHSGGLVPSRVPSRVPSSGSSASEIG